jgi:hypothetical protein
MPQPHGTASSEHSGRLLAVFAITLTMPDHLCDGLSGEFDIEHSTFQLETADRRRLEQAHHA